MFENVSKVAERAATGASRREFLGRLGRGAMVAAALLIVVVGSAEGEQVYLNDSNISVVLGTSMAAEPFENRTTAASLASVIDAPSADVSEIHSQSTHVWVSGGSLELDFDLGTEYDLQTLHFWNYFTEAFDVDNIDFTFFGSNSNLVGSLLNVEPALGGAGGNPIFAEDLPLSFPAKVQFVNAVLTGSNNQVDFNNIGFTAVLSVPEPSTLLLLGLGLSGVVRCHHRRKKAVWESFELFTKEVTHD